MGKICAVLEVNKKRIAYSALMVSSVFFDNIFKNPEIISPSNDSSGLISYFVL